MFSALFSKTSSTTAVASSRSPILRRLTQMAPGVSAAAFSTTASNDKETIFNEIISAASEISDYNYKSYFVRRATEDKAKIDSFTIEELQERLA